MMKTAELNINIPRSRGMIKWMPFATMPERYENIGKSIESQSHVPKPSLNIVLQQELELNLRQLEGNDAIIRYWSDGYEIQMECVIAYIDDYTYSVITIKDEEYIQIKFENIYEVSTGGMF